MKDKICHISTVHSAFDDRIFYKECISLSNNYETHLIVSHTHHEIVNGVQIHALSLSNSLFLRLVWKQFIAFIQVFQIQAKICHLHDPELIPLGMLLKICGKKVVFDMHEFSYFHILGKTWAPRWLIQIFANIYRWIEGIAFRYFFDHIVLVVNEGNYFNYIQSRYETCIHKFTVVRNFSILEMIKHKKTASINTNAFVIIYAGGLSVVRGIYEIIQALEPLSGVELWLLGPWETQKYQEQCMSLAASVKVRYFGKVKMEEVYPYMKRANVGIANLYPIENYLTSLPIKAFEYMACKIPMIMSDFPYWKTIFSECSLFVDAKKPQDITLAIAQLQKDHELCKNMGNKGYQLVQERYSWESESIKLIDLYHQILQ